MEILFWIAGAVAIFFVFAYFRMPLAWWTLAAGLMAVYLSVITSTGTVGNVILLGSFSIIALILNVPALRRALISDRVLAALRPAWKQAHPEIDCRSFSPGATFDPDWMDDHSRASMRRPVISEMLSWAVFEKTDMSRRVIAKARVTAD